MRCTLSFQSRRAWIRNLERTRLRSCNVGGGGCTTWRHRVWDDWGPGERAFRSMAACVKADRACVFFSRICVCFHSVHFTAILYELLNKYVFDYLPTVSLWRYFFVCCVLCVFFVASEDSQLQWPVGSSLVGMNREPAEWTPTIVSVTRVPMRKKKKNYSRHEPLERDRSRVTCEGGTRESHHLGWSVFAVFVESVKSARL